MTDYSEWSVEKSVVNYVGDDDEKNAAAETARAEYSAAAEWCNDNGEYTIEDMGEKYAVVKLDNGENENA